MLTSCRFLLSCVLRKHRFIYTEVRFLSDRRSVVRTKVNVWDHFTRREILTLFLQPFCVIIAYLAIMWHFIKYSCNVNDLGELIARARWLAGNNKLSKDKIKSQMN